MPDKHKPTQSDYDSSLPQTELRDDGEDAAKQEQLQKTPTKIGRFRIERSLGRGGFGVVYLATDEQLHRKVAIKVPHPHLIQEPADAELYLKEARTVAGLEHPHIVPVLEVGSTDEFPIFVVSKYIDGMDLAAQIQRARPTATQSVQWIVNLADALRTAHKQGIVHRDVKPQNVIVDANMQVYLVDFGLALRDEEVGKRLPAGGTPIYMSPEQAKGDGHRVDGRSDIFSLGVLFYELLAGRRPFTGASRLELFEQITEHDPKPIRQWDDSVDQELDRICTKMLAKRKSDRFSSAKDLMDDLRAYLDASKSEVSSVSVARPLVLPTVQAGVETPVPIAHETPMSATPTSGSRTLKIVPKGLRSFDHHDADFFLELLPGPRDRNGLPDTIGFWKTRIEERDSDKSFNVGLVYGPSGCGKSSMMKAGLIPRLSKDVIAIYLEATSDQTEAMLLGMLRKRLDAERATHKESWSLLELLTAIRRGKVLPAGKKLLLVIDQFEQWLYSHALATGQDLLDSLLQCDGSRLQCIVMVRDDFWMAATRFFRDLDIRLLDGHNSAAVDLFDLDHAERVLKAFGRAFGKLDSESKSDSGGNGDKNGDKQDRKQFMTEAVRGLAEDNKVISVRLSLFAEMMKGRQWTPESLKEVGGTSGVGATFLEETFSASGAPPEHRYHQAAARAVLRSLLPDGGTEIKGHRRSRQELLIISGYVERPRDFADLIRMLDSELRLITPTDTEAQALAGTTTQNQVGSNPAGINGASSVPASVAQVASQGHYQLTHDYLVPSLRDWLTRKQRETRKGRAELKLAERSAAWNTKQEAKQLPTLNEWFGITWLTERKQWTEPQRLMMRRATRTHVTRMGVAMTMFVALASVAFAGKRYIDQQREVLIALKEIEQNEATASGLVGNLDRVEAAKLADFLDQLPPVRKYAADDLKSLYDQSEPQSVGRLHAALGLLSISEGEPDKGLVQFVSDRLLESTPESFLAVRAQLAKYRNDAIVAEYWRVAFDASSVAGRRFRAGAALAMFDPTNPSWSDSQVTEMLSNNLVDLNPVYLATWQQAFLPVSKRLLQSLQSIFANTKTSETQKSLATSLIADYAKDEPKALVATMIEADPKSFATLLPVLKIQGSGAIAELEKILDRKREPQWNDIPLDPKWTVPDASVRTAIELAHGMIDERFAFAQDMPLAKFLEVAEALRASGYRPTRVRPLPEPQALAATTVTSKPAVTQSGTIGQFGKSRLVSTINANPAVTRLAPAAQVSVVWTRDRKRWLIETDVAKPSLPAIDQVAEKDGMLLEDISTLPLVGDNDEPTFIALWSEPISSDEKRWALVDVDESVLKSTDTKIRAGKSAKTISVRTDKNRDRHYCVIWSSQGEPYELNWCEEGFDLIYKPQFEVAWAPPQRFPNPLEPYRASVAKFEALPEDKQVDPTVRNESLATAYYQIGKFEQALAEIDQLIEKEKSSESVLLYRTLALARLGRAEEAREAVEKFISATKTESFKPYTSIQVAAFLGDWKLAIELLASAATQYANDTDGLYNIACAAALCLSASAVPAPGESAIYATKTIELLEQLLAMNPVKPSLPCIE